MICAIPRNRKSVAFQRHLHINRYYFRENITLTSLIPFIHNNLVFLFLLLCRFGLFCQFCCICASNSLKKQDFNEKGNNQCYLDTPAHCTQGSFYNVVTLKMRSRSSKPNHFSPRPVDVSVLVWSNSSHWFKR